MVNGQVLGGDNRYVYTGTYESDGKGISARVLIRNFSPMVPSVLGIQGDFELTLQGKIEGNTIKASARHFVNQAGPGLVAKFHESSRLVPP